MPLTKPIQYPKVRPKDVAGFFWRAMKPDRWWAYFLVFCIIGANICAIIAPIFYKQFFDVISAGGEKAMLATALLGIVMVVLSINFLQWLFQ